MAKALFDAGQVTIPIVAATSKASKTGKAGKAGVIDSQAKRIKNGASRRRAEHRAARCAEVIGELEHNETIHVVSAAEWSTHDLIAHLVETTGPVDLWFATWSISEDGLRAMLRLREQGKVRSVQALLDWRIKVRKPEVAQLAKAQVDQLRVYSCHAKVYILRNKQWGVSICSSANLTNNPRIEASVITEDRELADWHIAWLKGVLRGAGPFEDDNG
jgi:hypothetical protein